ncbi:helix-turn-helix domain-containing protein [Bacillus salipaludis]|uniref:Helix-turn-helix domain-containing protein n=1 Tax=Bacillus salipaludis TaxID=2547811 RepID=A0A4R5VLV0_9BACI|nr:helix-turn-helix domain-containing protein [Bacillus salipaludis]
MFVSKTSFTPEFKIEALNAWEKGNYSLAEIVKMFKVFESTIREWKYQFDTYGIKGLEESSIQTRIKCYFRFQVSMFSCF